MTQNQTPDADREIVITRLLNAPVALVYKAWTTPDQVVKWWGPNGFSNTIHQMDVKPGGMWKLDMHGYGMTFPNRIIFTEVVENTRLVYTHDSGIDNDPAGFHVTVTFEAEGDKTRLTMRSLFTSAEEREKVVKEYGAIEGGNQTLDKLETFLTENKNMTEQKFTISRTFNAPRELVFKAFTEADRMAQWWGPKGFTMEVNNLDLRPGGKYHYCMVSPEGYKMWGLFVYREIEAPERIVFVNSFSDAEGALTRHPMAPNWPLEVLNTMTLTEHNGQTTMTISGAPINATQEETSLFHSMQSSMEQGFAGTFDQLEDYLAKHI